jgi:ABC-type sugar transport system ATPase subunit
MSDANGMVVAEGISKRFDETIALNGCSVTIQPGEVHAIVGENGSGKSTLVKIFSGVVLPDAGTVSVFGDTPRNPMHARSLGVATIFQEILVADRMSIVDNIFAGTDTLWNRSRTRSQAREQVRDILKRLIGSEINPDALVADFPLSVQQWVVIARALLANPRLVIFDESSAALDLDATNRLHSELRRLRDEGRCVVIVTHRIAELIRIADRATVLRDGRVVGEIAAPNITESSLLGMMSAKSVKLEASPKSATAILPSPGEVVLSGRDLCIKEGAPSFDFDLCGSEVVGVTGLDGQGQSEFIRALVGLRQPASGHLTALGNDCLKPVRDYSEATRGGIAYISGDRAHDGIFPNLSIFENFALPLYRNSVGEFGWIAPQPFEEAFSIEVKRLSIKVGRAANNITSLSGGNQQKVLIGRAFATFPDIVVLEDPARGVDVETKRELYMQLKHFAQEGGAVVYMSSEVEEFFNFADRVLIFRAHTLFRTLSCAELSEHGLLAAMFGEAETSDKIESLIRH